jgi:cytochrome c553
MKIITQTVTEADLADILAYYAAIKITVEVPE